MFVYSYEYYSMYKIKVNSKTIKNPPSKAKMVLVGVVKIYLKLINYIRRQILNCLTFLHKIRHK